MAQRLPRHDHYGARLPDLQEAQQEPLYGKPFNVAVRQRLHGLLEEQYQALLRRHISADVTVTFRIREGILQPDVQVGAVRRYHFRLED